MIDSSSVIETFENAITHADSDIFPEFSTVRQSLLDNSPITKNRPLFHGIVDNIIHYKLNGQIIVPVPFEQLKSDETKQMCEDFVEKHKSDLDDVNINDTASVIAFLSQIGVHGIRVLLGIRKTAAYEAIFPPNTEKLYEVFHLKHKDTNLTVGGRALSKHSVRDSSNFWEDATGPTDKINAAALRSLEKVVEYSVWNNVFALPHDSKAYEIRSIEGYGARWEFKGDGNIIFRGFVEPAMEDGHAKKWRH